MSNCPACGANFPITNFVCEYCGHVITERVKKVELNNSNEISFSESIDIIRENLNALHEIHRPTIKEAILGVIRIILALQTFGIILLFWKKQAKRFNKKNYNKLKPIVARNISQLKVSSKGSNQLLGQINIVEKELHEIDDEIKKSIRSKQIFILLTIAVYITIIFVNRTNKKGMVKIKPYEKFVTGQIDNHIRINNISCYVKPYNSTEYLENIEILVKVSVKEAYELNENEKLGLELILRDDIGDYITVFDSSKISNEDIKKVEWMLKHGVKKPYILRFMLKPKKRMFSIPKNIKHFSIFSSIVLKKE